MVSEERLSPGIFLIIFILALLFVLGVIGIITYTSNRGRGLDRRSDLFGEVINPPPGSVADESRTADGTIRLRSPIRPNTSKTRF